MEAGTKPGARHPPTTGLADSLIHNYHVAQGEYLTLALQYSESEFGTRSSRTVIAISDVSKINTRDANWLACSHQVPHFPHALATPLAPNHSPIFMGHTRAHHTLYFYVVGSL
jgi:hypothetical protein